MKVPERICRLAHCRQLATRLPPSHPFDSTHIFNRYLELGSVHALCEELARDGYRTKLWTSKSGTSRGGILFTRGGLYKLLGNEIYVGEIRHGNLLHPGQHPAIIDRELFDAAQIHRQRRKVVRRERSTSRAPLSGILYDALGNRMSATHARGRGGQRYVYYISRVPASHADAQRVLRRAPAAAIEDLLISCLRRWSGRQGWGWSELMPYLKRVELHQEALIVELVPPAHEDWTSRIDHPDQWAITPAGVLRIIHVARIVTRGGRAFLSGVAARAKARPDRPLIAGLRRAHRELRCRGINMADPKSQLKEARGVDDPYLRKLTKLAFLAPDIQRRILEGRQPPGMTLGDLLTIELPLDWHRQREILGFAQAPRYSLLPA